MKFLIRKCPKCYRYTLEEKCPICGTATAVAHPPRFSPVDKYVKYRIIMREESSTIQS